MTAAGAVSGQAGAALVAHNVPARAPTGEVCALWLTLENRGTLTWPASLELLFGIDGTHVLSVTLPHAVEAHARVTLHAVLRTPIGAGRHQLRFALTGSAGGAVAAEWFVPFETHLTKPTTTSALRDAVLENHARCWLVNDGVTQGQLGPGYPQFARTARGCRIVDIEDREYVDYLMGWGSALLGYAHARIQRALARALESAAITTLTPRLMPELAERLCALFPGAQAATFGKNGSDACTAAVRMARVYTGRPVVLFCGYHGWQDWNAEGHGFAATGIPGRAQALALRFEPNNLEQVLELLARHEGQVAAVMLEPAGVIESSSGPIRDADPSFLMALAEHTRRAGALLVFDEILTGFRYQGGSVQHATGVQPDLTCLGKALGGGMPLSALIGSKAVFDRSVGRIFYEPTYKGEMYSFAAAHEALSVYADQDVPGQVWAFGQRLRALLEGLCQRFGVPARVVGPPFRMLLAFEEPDARRRVLMRTLVQQELLRHGVLSTQNLLLPSLAHDDAALETTRQAYERAFEKLVEAMDGERFASYLEIPPLPG